MQAPICKQLLSCQAEQNKTDGSHLSPLSKSKAVRHKQHLDKNMLQKVTQSTGLKKGNLKLPFFESLHLSFVLTAWVSWPIDASEFF